MTWKLLKREFQKNYLTKMYFDENDREFHELRLGQSTINGFLNKFMSLMIHVTCLKDKK